VPKELILFSISLEIIHDSQPYNNTVTQVVLNRLILVDIGMLGLFQRCSNFQKAVQARALLHFRSLSLDFIIEPKYLKSSTWLIALPYTCSGGCGWQLIVMNSVLGAQMMRPRSAAA